MIPLEAVIAPLQSPAERREIFDDVMALWVDPSPDGELTWGCWPEDALENHAVGRSGVCLTNSRERLEMLLGDLGASGRVVLALDELVALSLPLAGVQGETEQIAAFGEACREPCARSLYRAWAVAEQQLLALPLPVIDNARQLAGSVGDAGLERLLFETTRCLIALGRSQPPDLAHCFAAERLRAVKRDVPEFEECEPLAAHASAELLGPEGTFAQSLPGYEQREGQLTMTREVTAALNAGRHLMVEAGTGVGKSLAYLLPAVLWARQNGTPVVVSTNTKNLQSQLFVKDLPLIQRLVAPDVKIAMIKGRGNYLCLRRLEYLLHHQEHELSDAERRSMLFVLAWAAVTRTGDLAELEGGPAAAAGRRVWSTAEECAGRGCLRYSRCALQKARDRSLQADVVVANHSLIFAEMSTPGVALPVHRQLVLDEAHNLEDAATRHFSIEVSQTRLVIGLRRLWRRRRKRGGGLLETVRRQIESGTVTGDAELSKRLARGNQAARLGLERVRTTGLHFFRAMGLVQRARRSRTVRLLKADRDGVNWAAVVEASEVFRQDLGAAARELTQLAELLRSATEEELGLQQDSVRDLDAGSAWLRELSTDVEFILSGDDAGSYVFWLEQGRMDEETADAWVAPLQIGEQLAQSLYGQKQSVILCSATLTVGGSFDFLSQRLGIDRVAKERITICAAESPFDYMQQCRVMVPLFLPEPGDAEGDYVAALGALLMRVFQRTRGRTLGLFTSYDMLRRCTAALKDAGIERSAFRLLAQGDGASREQITRCFRDDVGSVLMGTHSFWEGVDVVGEALSCVVIARLPFAAVGDPLVEARCEQIEKEGRSAFMSYMLPSAVIRFRQGFGRLIRHRGDRGIVIVADRRIMTRRYGPWFRRSLPAATIASEDPGRFLDAIDEFMADADIV